MKSTWISVDEALPPRDEVVLVTDGVDISVGDYGLWMGEPSWQVVNTVTTEDDEREIGYCDQFEPTHWMRLPSKPKVAA